MNACFKFVFVAGWALCGVKQFGSMPHHPSTTYESDQCMHHQQQHQQQDQQQHQKQHQHYHQHAPPPLRRPPLVLRNQTNVCTTIVECTTKTHQHQHNHQQQRQQWLSTSSPPLLMNRPNVCSRAASRAPLRPNFLLNTSSYLHSSSHLLASGINRQ